MDNTWVVYGLVCARKKDYVAYIGITNNFEARFLAHKNGNGAKFTKSFKPVFGAILERGLFRFEAARKEHIYKKLPSATKLALIHSNLEKPL